MLLSQISWSKKDYFRLVSHLWEINEVKYGDLLLENLKKRLPMMVNDDYLYNKSFDHALNYAKELKTDLLEIHGEAAVCSECSIYQNRIYSISGKDSRFPKLPQFILDNKGLHCHNGIFATFYYNGQTLTVYTYDKNGNCALKEMDAITYSNRPFVDNRNIAEIKYYENWKLEHEKNKKPKKNSMTVNIG